MEDFLTREEIDSLRGSCHRIVDEMNPADHAKVVFSTNEEQVYSRWNLMFSSIIVIWEGGQEEYKVRVVEEGVVMG